jgi:retinol dehydrogenase-12
MDAATTRARTALITGANTGIGRITALALAKAGMHVVLAGRSQERTANVQAEIQSAGGASSFIALDLGDLESVRACAQTFVNTGRPLHLLVNNAGLAGQRGMTKQGFELAFGTNHLGHFLLTRLLLPALQSSAPSRIVNVSSASHYKAKGIDFSALQRATRSPTGLPEYEVSKLANVLFTKELSRGRAGAGITSVALHPGVVASDVWRGVPWPLRGLIKLFMLSNEEGAQTSIHCALSEALEDGGYYDKQRPRKPSARALDAALATQLWKHSEAWVSAYAEPLSAPLA